MAGGSVKLSIYSTFKDDGTKQAEKAVDRFAKKFGKLDKETGKVGIDSATEALVRQSVAADQAAARWAGYSDKLAAAGEKITKYVSAPAAAAITASTKLASDYEDSFAKVKTIMDKQAVPVETLQHDLLDLSTSTGKAATELSDATYQALSASVETSKVAGFVEDSANLAKAGFTDTATAVDALTTIINAYKLSADQASEISDKLVQTQNDGKTTVGELGASLGTIIPTAAALNVNLDNVMASYALMTKQGIKTTDATTALKNTLSELSDGGSDVAKILKDHTGKTFGELMNEGASLGDVLNILYDHVEGNSEAFKNLWGNSRAGTGALAIANAGAEGFSEELANMQNASGNVAAALEDLVTPSSRANKALNALKNIGIELGQEYLGALAPALEQAVDLAQRGFEAFDNLSEGEKQSAAQAIALGAAAGPAVLGLSKITGGISSGLSAYGRFSSNLAKVASGTGRAAQAAKLLGAATSGPALLGIAALAGGAVVCAKGIVDTKQRIDDLSDSTKLLAEATTSGAPTLEAAAGTSEKRSQALVHEKVSVEDVTRAQANLAREIESRNSSAQAEISTLERAKDTIHEYANKTNLSVEQQGELRAAIELVNESCGTQYSVVDAANGKLADEEGQILKNCDAIDQYIAKKQEQVRVEALTQDLAGLHEQREKDLAAVASATREYNQALSDLKAAEQAGVTGERWQEYADRVRDTEQALGEARGDLDSCNAAIESNERALGSAAKASEGAEQTVADLARNTQELYATIDDPAAFEAFCGQLEDTGISVEDFKKLNQDQLLAISEAYDGSIGSIESTLDQFGVVLPQKTSEAAQGAAAAVAKASPEMQGAIQGATSAMIATMDVFAGKAAASGGKASNQYAGGISSGEGQVSGAASKIASAAGGMQVSGSWNWGNSIASNFASGILAGVSAVSSASNQLASAAAGPIRHSVPKEGPLRNHGLGEAGWGRETVANYARGMTEMTGYVRAAAIAAASAAAGGLQGSPQPRTAGAIAAGAAMPQAAFADLLAAKMAAQLASVLGDKVGTTNYWGGIQYTDGTAIGDMLTELAHAVQVEEGC